MKLGALRPTFNSTANRTFKLVNGVWKTHEEYNWDWLIVTLPAHHGINGDHFVVGLHRPLNRKVTEFNKLPEGIQELLLKEAKYIQEDNNTRDGCYDPF